MEILKRGIIPENIEIQFKCSNCKSELKASRKDAIKETYDQRDGNYATFNCPVCNKQIHVNVEKFIGSISH